MPTCTYAAKIKKKLEMTSIAPLGKRPSPLGAPASPLASPNRCVNARKHYTSNRAPHVNHCPCARTRQRYRPLASAPCLPGSACPRSRAAGPVWHPPPPRPSAGRPWACAARAWKAWSSSGLWAGGAWCLQLGIMQVQDPTAPGWLGRDAPSGASLRSGPARHSLLWCLPP